MGKVIIPENMKKSIAQLLFFVSCICSGLSFAQGADYADLYYNNDLEKNPGKWDHGILDDAKNWNVGSVDGPVSESKPSASDNLWIEAAIIGQTGFVTGWNGNMDFHDFNMSLALATESADLISNVENQTVTAWGDMNFAVKPVDGGWGRQTNILMEDNSVYRIKGDVNLDITGRTNFKIRAVADYGDDPWPVTNISQNSSFIVDGNFNVVQNQRNGEYETLALEINASNFMVSGVMDVTQKSQGSVSLDLKYTYGANMQTASDCSFDSNISLGGLKGDANLLVSDVYAGAAGRAVYLEFSNASSSEWSGSFSNDTGLKMHLLMLGASSGSQTMRSQSGALDSVTVSSGSLNLYSAENMGALRINGASARLGIVGQNSTSGYSTLKFSSAEWQSGSIEFDIAAYGMNDALAIDGAFNKTSNASNLVIELNVSAYDLGLWLDEEGVEYLDFDLITFGSTNMGKEDISVLTQDRVFCEILALDSGKLTARLSLQVPEPAAIASIFGFLALGLGALRRRR